MKSQGRRMDPRNMRTFLPLLLLCIIHLFTITDAAISNAMSIDLGTEFMKLALVKPGVPMETVLNRESHRKTPFAIMIRQKERVFGDEALKKAISAPRHTFTFFLDLIGKKFEHPAVADYQKRFPHLELKRNEQRGTVNFMTDAGELPIETLLAMVLANARAEVEAYAGQPVIDVVIAIPAAFGPAERSVVEVAAKIAGLNLIQQLSAGAAAGLNYGVFRIKDITEEPQTHLIYDIGSTKVQATVLRYQLFNETLADGSESKESSKKSTPGPIPKLDVVGFGFDTQLGGHLLTLKVRDFLIEQFRKQHPSTEGGADITTSPQAMAKLLKEAGRVKQVLSANTETFAQIESVFQDLDFRAKINRQQFEEEMFKEYEERHLTPIKNAVEMAQLDGVDKLDKVLLMGAGTRIPRLQTLLEQFFNGKQLGRNLNTDEAIALGAVYQAARVSKNFIVKRFDVVDSEPPAPPAEEEFKPMSEGEIEQAKTLLTEFEKLEKAKAERDAALHSLESSVFDYTYKLDEEEFKKFGTGEEIESLGKLLSELREWLEDIPMDINADQLKEKKRELMRPVRKLRNRRKQKEERPEQMKNLEKVLDDADKQLLMFRNTTDIFADGELDTFGKIITDTQVWFKTVKGEAEKLEDNQDATFSTDDLKSKANTLNREAKFLFNKVIISIRQKEEAERAAKKAAEEEAKKKAEEEEKAKAGEDGTAEKTKEETEAKNGTASEEEQPNAETTKESSLEAEVPMEVDETKTEDAKPEEMPKNETLAGDADKEREQNGSAQEEPKTVEEKKEEDEATDKKKVEL